MEVRNLLIRLPEELHRRIKTYAFQKDKSMAEVVRLAITNYLSRRSDKK